MDSQKLIHGGRTLQGNRTLSDYGIHNESTLWIEFSFRGGMQAEGGDGSWGQASGPGQSLSYGVLERQPRLTPGPYSAAQQGSEASSSNAVALAPPPGGGNGQDMQPEEWSPPKATLREEVERLRAQLKMTVQREEHAVQVTANACRDHAYNVFEGQQHGFWEAAARFGG